MNTRGGMLMRFRNTRNDKCAHVLCFRMKKDDARGKPRYAGIMQEDSWSNWSPPSKLRVGGIAGFDAEGFSQGEPVAKFPHKLVFPTSVDDLIEPNRD